MQKRQQKKKFAYVVTVIQFIPVLMIGNGKIRNWDLDLLKKGGYMKENIPEKTREKKILNIKRTWQKIAELGIEQKKKEEEIIIKQSYTPPEKEIEYKIVPEFNIPSVIAKGRHPLSVVRSLFYPRMKHLNEEERYEGENGVTVYEEKLADPVFRIEFIVTNMENGKKWLIRIIGNDWFAERILSVSDVYPDEKKKGGKK